MVVYGGPFGRCLNEQAAELVPTGGIFALPGLVCQLLSCLCQVSGDSGYSLGEFLAFRNGLCPSVLRAEACIRPTAAVSRKDRGADCESSKHLRFRLLLFLDLSSDQAVAGLYRCSTHWTESP